MTIWECSTGHTSEFPAGATTLRFSPGGEFLGAGDRSGHVVVWSLAESRVIDHIDAGPTKVTALAFTLDLERGPDGRQSWLLAVGKQGGEVALHKLGGEGVEHVFRGCDFFVSAVDFTPDGTSLIAAGHSITRLWDLATGRPLIQRKLLEDIQGLAFNTGGDLLGAFRATGPGSLFRTCSLSLSRGIRVLPGLRATVNRVTFSPNESLIAALSSDWKVAVWDAGSGRLLLRLPVTPGETADNGVLAISPDNRLLAFSAGQSAEIWDLRRGHRIRTWTFPDGLVDQLVFPTPDRLLSFRAERPDGPGTPWIALLRDLLSSPDGGPPIVQSPPMSPRVYVSAASRDGSLFVVEGDEPGARGPHHSIHVVDSQNSQFQFTRATALEGATGSIEFDPTGRMLRFEHRNGPGFYPHNVLLDLRSGRARDVALGVVAIGPSGNPVLSISDSPVDGPDPLLSLSIDGRADALLLGLDRAANRHATIFDRSGKHLALGCVDGRVLIADLPSVATELNRLQLGWHGPADHE